MLRQQRSAPPLALLIAQAALTCAFLTSCTSLSDSGSSGANRLNGGENIFGADRIFSDIELRDANNKKISAEDLAKRLPEPIFVRYKNKELVGASAEADRLTLQKRLSAMTKSDLAGAFIYVPWVKNGGSNSLVRLGHFTALTIPGRPEKIFVCGGDESPNNVHFAADKTWIFDSSKKTIEPGPGLNYARKDPVLTAMPDGKILISSGNAPALELFDPQTMQVSKEGIFAEAGETVAAVPLGNGLVLLICKALASHNAIASLRIALPTLRPILYDPVKKELTPLPPLKDLTRLYWSGAVGSNQALLLGSRARPPFDPKAVGKSMAELVTTQRVNP